MGWSLLQAVEKTMKQARKIRLADSSKLDRIRQIAVNAHHGTHAPGNGTSSHLVKLAKEALTALVLLRRQVDDSNHAIMDAAHAATVSVGRLGRIPVCPSVGAVTLARWSADVDGLERSTADIQSIVDAASGEEE
ncbi:hypothetical protein LTR17_001011 [Elasticomyces elasticus]|nr:hypothetical protein LTR17_001011 [Elasticomyces elasticus]